LDYKKQCNIMQPSGEHCRTPFVRILTDSQKS
jgi:hypothetical protein